MTLAEVPRWREALLAALAEGKDLRVDLAAAGPWDLAGLQLILAALATGRRAGRSIRLVRVPQVFRAIAERAALTDVLAEAIESDEDPARRAERPLSQPVPR
ncbi:MAG: STAS domain-containing protein [Isosphaeraceae bacterium]|nr:STAS domain-containing protein [Isosphaeraceae bacterium]